jgi:AcrR family transcriptional regulator
VPKTSTEGGDRQGDAYDRIFLAAEQLFAEFGYEGVSVRDIVQAAGIHLAAVNYHFGSKHELLMAVYAKRIRELDQERLDVLRAAEAAHHGAPPLAAILRAYLTPPIRWRDPASGKATSIRFVFRLTAAPTPKLRAMLEGRVKGLSLFREALARFAPQASASEMNWAVHFVTVLSHHGSAGRLKRLVALSEGACDIDDIQADIDRVVRFAAAGFASLLPPGASAPE